MEKSKLKKLILTMQDPLFVETEGLGTIALSHWSVKATQDISNILEGEIEGPADFIRQFIEKLGRMPSVDEKPAEKYDNGTPIQGVDNLTQKDLEKVANSYIAKYKNSILHWVSSEEGERDEFALEKEEGESPLEYFLRIVRLSVEKSTEQSKKLLEKLTSSGATKSIFEQFNKNQFKIGSIADRINDIQKTYAFPSPIEPRTFEIPELPPNPVYETNDLLKSQTAQLRGLSELLEAQGEQTVLLNDQTGLLIGQSNASSRQAKIGIWVAAAGVFLSTIVSGYAIYRGMESSEESSRSTKELVVIQRNNNELEMRLNELLQELNATMEVESRKNSDNTEVLTQLRELTNVVKAKDDSDVVHAIEQLSKQMAGQGANKWLKGDAEKAPRALP